MGHDRVKDWKILLLALVAASLSAYAGFRINSTRVQTTTADTASPAASVMIAKNDALIKDLAGREHSLSEWDGKILVVNFWATWCLPCIVEIPTFVKLQAELGARGLQFVGVALDDRAAAATFAAERAINYPVLVGDDDVARLMQSLGNEIGALPYTVVFDRDGNIVHTQQGEWELAEARRILKPLLDPLPGNQQVKP